MRKLLLLDFSGVRYGVWEDTVPSIRSARGLQRLPLSPADIAGIALLDERSAVIADLGVCLGRPPLARPRDGSLLVLNVAAQVAGFCVASDFTVVACPETAILPLPSAVATSVADSCALLDAVLIPIINLEQLQQRLQQGWLDLPALPLPPPPDSCDLAAVRAVQVVALGGARFCVDAGQSSWALLPAGGVVPLPLRSARLAGITCHAGEVLPVLLPGALPGFGIGVGQGGLLVTGSPQGRYALAVDADLGVIAGAELALLPLPQLAARPWLPASTMTPAESILFVDSSAFAAVDTAAGARPP